ncbi:MAG: dihydroorotate dehydrogenase [Coriobacteriales bacterium]|nr:dihydroorotate dehydrogenase [Coriobacteriales bacterium]
MVSNNVGKTVPNMAVNLGGIEMRNPVNTASGTFGNGIQFEGFYDVGATLGAMTCKGVAAEPWVGNPAPRLAELPSAIMNSVGLQNPGVEGFVERYGAYLASVRERGCAVICQVAGHSIDEYVRAMQLFEEKAPFASGFELNISCPNIAKGGAAMGATPESAAEVMRAVRPHTTRPIVVKMAPHNVAEIGWALEDAGADALSLINTIPGMAIDVRTRRSKLARPTAGVSGPAIHAIAVRMVWECAQAVQIPLCGIGGVATGTDAAEMILAGATAVSVGTANLYDPTAAERVVRELAAWASEQGVESINELRGAFEC